MKTKAVAKKKVHPIPSGYGAVIPYLSVRGAAEAIDFYKKAFGAKETVRMPGPDGKLGPAEAAEAAEAAAHLRAETARRDRVLKAAGVQPN